MSETNKFYQYDRNDNNTFGVRGTASGGGTEVVANPELAGTEAALTGLQVGETKYKVDQPINVVANPTLAGTESALTGLEVGTTKYKVDSGISQTAADERYLQLSGGTMTGNITLTGNYIKAGSENVFTAGNGTTDNVAVGSLNINSNLELRTGDTADLVHRTPSSNKTVLTTGNTRANPTLAGTEAALTGIKVNGTSYKNQPASVSYLTTAPSSANTDGLKFVVLTSEPATYYNGYYYIIAPST